MSEAMSYDHSEDLEAARKQEQNQQSSSKTNSEDHQNSSAIGNASNNTKNIIKSVSPIGLFSAIKQANFLKDLPFMAALMFAILKDLFDFLFNATVILGMLFSVLCSIFIFMMLLLAGSGDKRKKAGGLLRKGIALIGGGLADSLPGFGFLPIETLTVFLIYAMVLQERANARK
jgi:hypothetical protein